MRKPKNFIKTGQTRGSGQTLRTENFTTYLTRVEDQRPSPTHINHVKEKLYSHQNGLFGSPGPQNEKPYMN